jgi:peptide-methionine (S)-S-oxide reductase
MSTLPQISLATFGGGCFWCTEAVFQRVKGVLKVTSGYAGGQRANPSYEQVSTGATHHAEVIQLEFDPNIITYAELLEIFWAVHDPTTLNQQGADRGTQYRSIIFYHDEKQHQQALESKAAEDQAKAYPDPIVTEIVPFTEFFTAEEYHQNFYNQNQDYPYCSIVIAPKIEKLLAKFNDRVKDEYKTGQ